MKFSIFFLAGLAASATVTHRPKYMENDALAHKALANLKAYVSKNGYPGKGNCTLETASVRKEWGSLPRAEKLDYINAVHCLAKLPAKTPASIAAGAKSRFDDLVVTHIQQTFTIHGTANFLPWHRYYVWQFGKMLREECGYNGHLPYWNWAHYAHDPKSGPLLDGSDTSLSGDGSYLPGRNSSCILSSESCSIRLYPGSGGGCVTSGPFKDWKINLGPLGSLMLPYLKPNPQADGLGYNPRCLRRDISKQAANATNDYEVSSLIKNNKDIATFQRVYQGLFEQGLLGVHSGGHYQVGGDAGSDFYNSPAEPTFFPHHGMIDRVWWTWQNLDIKNRQYAIAGGTLLGGGGPNGTLDDIITLGDYVGAPNITMREAMNSLAGPFCYIYV
ncbi:hypothetical protein PTNB73_06874 [Pyrenophora teres f. teres]|nr:hypothetical protein HRS9122_09966 [Pyrenophora teres f. teres]KAE8863667.1 hypothetical protein PTNB73_06874 [Pyrenophora teres f. teres]